MNKILIIFSILVLSLLISCNKYSKNKIYQVNHIKDIKSNIPFNVTQIQHSVDTSLFKDNFTYFDSRNNTLGIYYIENNNNKKIPIPLQNFVKKRRTYSDFFIHSMDSIYYFDRDLKGIFLFDSSGEIIDKSSLKSKYAPNPVVSNFFVFSKNLYYSWFPETDMSIRLNRRYTFDTIRPICEIKFDSTTNTDGFNCFGVFPDNYKTGNNYYDFGPNIFVGLHNQIVISYMADHNIYVYQKSELTDRKVCKSNFIDVFKGISDEDFSNLTYCRTYQGQEPRYTKLIIDPYKKRYYRVAKLRTEIGKVDINSAKWTMVIMNESFDIIGEAVLPYSDYMPDIIIPSADGIYIKKTPENKDQFNGLLTLSLIEFTR